jgi:GxxExxY protein
MESVYQDCLAIEFRRRGLTSVREQILTIDYKGERIPSTYKADFVVGGVLVELKAKSELAQADQAQVVNYLRATGLQLGLLLNFGEGRLITRRFVNGLNESSSAASAFSA